jgi:hypothetical protein
MEPNPLCAQLPVFDLAVFLGAQDKGAPEVQRLCSALAACLRHSSALVVRDPRVDTADNEAFLSLLERYFSQPLEAKLADVRADLAYQVGRCEGANSADKGAHGQRSEIKSERCCCLRPAFAASGCAGWRHSRGHREAAVPAGRGHPAVRCQPGAAGPPQPAHRCRPQVEVLPSRGRPSRCHPVPGAECGACAARRLSRLAAGPGQLGRCAAAGGAAPPRCHASVHPPVCCLLASSNASARTP